jgi:hypothetical protein
MPSTPVTHGAFIESVPSVETDKQALDAKVTRPAGLPSSRGKCSLDLTNHPLREECWLMLGLMFTLSGVGLPRE